MNRLRFIRARLTRPAWVLALALWGVCPAVSSWGANIIIDHTNWDWITAQPQAVSDSIAAQTLFFAHASVGANVMSGFADLHGANATKYPLTQTSATGTPPASTVAGRIYEYARGNPAWSTKVSDFTTYIQNGWNQPKVDFVMNKFCYIDQTADWTVYRDAMLALEAANPTTRFIYWTMPLMTSSDGDEVLRAQFNTNLRNWVATQEGKLLFDIADIEAWSPAGVHQTFLSGSTYYEHMYTSYSSDGGHLNSTGYDRMATGLYSLLGQAVQLFVTSTPTPGSSPTHTPTLTQTLTRTPTPTITLTRTPTSTRTATLTATITRTGTPTSTPSLTLTTTPVLSSTPTSTCTPVLSPIATATVTSTPTHPPLTPEPLAAGAWAYPNPARDQVRFSVSTAPGDMIEVRVFNFQGERIGKKQVPAAEGTQTVVLWDCADMASGMYLAQLEVSGKKRQRLKFAVRH